MIRDADTAMTSALPEEQLRRRRRAVHPFGAPLEFADPAAWCSFPQRFAEVVAQCGDRVALRCGAERETYAELDARTNASARALLDRLGPGSEPVGVWFDQTLDAVRACIAVLKAGKYYVPLDATAPDERNVQILDECGARALLCGAPGRHAAEPSSLRSRMFDRLVLDPERIIVGVSADPLDVEIHPHDPAYVTFTSGSTGAPKGVVEDHGDVLYVAWMYRHGHHICPDDCVGLWRRWAFGGGQLHLFAAFCNGAALTLAPSGASVPRWMADDGVTITTASPSMLRAMMDSLAPGMRLPDTLRAIVIGSEPLLVSDVERLWRVVPRGCVLRNTYGATEALSATALYLEPDDRFDGDVVPAGWAAHDGEMLVLRSDGERCAVGEVGDVYVRRKSTAAGYWGRPQETRDRFTVDGDGMRRYRFGDKGRLRADGCLDVLGRDDDFVKVNGFPASTSAVEAALGRLSSVAAAVVFAWTDASGQLRLAAKVKARDGASPGLPLTATGKVDRRALSVSGDARPPLTQEYVAPRNELERQIAAIWEAVLHVRPIGVRDAFFDLGGDSLRVGQVLERLRNLLGRELDWAFVKRASTVEAMAQLLASSERAHRSPLSTLLHGDGDRPPLVLCPPSGGVAIGFLRLASFLGERQPIYVLQPQGLDGVHPPHDTVEAMADAYAAELEAVDRRRPLRMLGVCNGAITACTLARRLAERGVTVDALIVIDAPVPQRIVARLRRVQDGAASRSEASGEVPKLDLRRWLDIRTAALRGRIRNRWLYGSTVRRVMHANARAFTICDVDAFAVFEGRALVVESLRPPAVRERFEAWRRVLVGDYTHVRMSSSTHRDLLSGRHAAELARVLSGWLDR